jgi:hypothetical protein
MKRLILSFLPLFFDLVATSRDQVTAQRKYPLENDYQTYKSLHDVDQYFSAMLHLYIGAFEKRLRSFVINSICSALKTNGDPECIKSDTFLNYGNGKKSLCLSGCDDFSMWESYLEKKKEQRQEWQDKSKGQRIKAVESLRDCFGPSCKKPSELTQHYLGKYQSIPAFIGMHTLSFSTTSLLFGLLPRLEQGDFWRMYTRRATHEYSDKELTSFLIRLKRVVDLRNTVNHYEPVVSLICHTYPPSVNSLLTILGRLRGNYIQSSTSLFITAKKPILPNMANDYNSQQYSTLKKALEEI